MTSATHIRAFSPGGNPITKVGKYTIPFRQLFMCQHCFKGTYTPRYFKGGILEGDAICDVCVPGLRSELGEEAMWVKPKDVDVKELSQEEKQTRTASKAKSLKWADKRRKEKAQLAKERKARAEFKAAEKARKAATVKKAAQRKRAKAVKAAVAPVVIEGEKTCVDCKVEKPFNQFHSRTYSSGTVGRQASCKECKKAKSAAAWADPTKQAVKRANKKAWLAKRTKEQSHG
jgi:hypothetical protein